MGLASDGKRWKILTDLQDLEDGKGGMDFKFTSTKDGITSIQMDTKTRGLSQRNPEDAGVHGRYLARAHAEVGPVLEPPQAGPRPAVGDGVPCGWSGDFREPDRGF